MLSSIKSMLTNPLIAGIVSGLLVMLCVYIDSKIRDIPRERDTYWKLGGVSSLIVATLVYLVSEEYTKTDEFLNQKYETELNGSMMPNKKGGFTVNPYQETLKGPQENIHELMASLEPSASTSEAPQMPKSLFKDVPNVSMTTDRIGKKSHGHKSHKYDGSNRSHRSHRSRH